MITTWTKHLKDDPEQKERFQNEVFNSRRVLDRLKAILEEIEQSQYKAERDPRTYEIPNWNYRQAHINGYLSAISTIKKLVDLDQQQIPERP